MLFKTDADIKKYLTGVNDSFKLAMMQSQVEDIERDVIRDILGDEELDSLLENYAKGESELTKDQAALLPYVCRANAYLALVEYIPFLNVDISPGGLRVAAAEGRQVASQYRTEDLKAASAKQGWKAVEALLLYLWKSIDKVSLDNTEEEGEPVYMYEKFAQSDNYNRYRCFFINTSKKIEFGFSWYHDIGESYSVFRRLFPEMMAVENDIIKPVLGEALFDEIKEQILDNDVSDENLKLMPLICRATAKLTVVQAVANFSLTLDDFGVYEKSVGTTGRDTINQKNPARDPKVDHYLLENAQHGNNALQQLKDLLYDNADDYPLFKNDSSVYISDTDILNVPLFQDNEDSETFMM